MNIKVPSSVPLRLHTLCYESCEIDQLNLTEFLSQQQALECLKISYTAKTSVINLFNTSLENLIKELHLVNVKVPSDLSLNLHTLCYESHDIDLESLTKLLSQQHNLEYLKISYTSTIFAHMTLDYQNFSDVRSQCITCKLEITQFNKCTSWTEYSHSCAAVLQRTDIPYPKQYF